MTAVFERQMGLTHADFFRTLPAAMGRLTYRIEGQSVIAAHNGKQVRIQLGPQQERRIALLRIPYVNVQFAFDGYSEAETQAFLDYFDSRFQRGGG